MLIVLVGLPIGRVLSVVPSIIQLCTSSPCFNFPTICHFFTFIVSINFRLWSILIIIIYLDVLVCSSLQHHVSRASNTSFSFSLVVNVSLSHDATHHPYVFTRFVRKILLFIEHIFLLDLFSFGSPLTISRRL